jgi:V/A-type H+-transporting ATPase subunit B
MNNGVGKGKTREGPQAGLRPALLRLRQRRGHPQAGGHHREDALTENDRRYLQFADAFERHFINQGQQNRSIEESLQIAWALLSMLPQGELKRISRDHIGKYYGQKLEEIWGTPQALD